MNTKKNYVAILETNPADIIRHIILQQYHYINVLSV